MIFEKLLKPIIPIVYDVTQAVNSSIGMFIFNLLGGEKLSGVGCGCISFTIAWGIANFILPFVNIGIYILAVYILYLVFWVFHYFFNRLIEYQNS